jgi:hypothetical protein
MASDFRTAAGDLYPPLDDKQLIDPPVSPYPDDAPPVLYGHYWEDGTPTIKAANAACTDYSACKGGPLVAYRWSGESALDNDNYVSAQT